MNSPSLRTEKARTTKISTKTLVLTGMMAAVLAVMSQISLPLPSGVPITMQTSAMALTGYVLGAGCGSLSVAVYLLVGLIGLPVFAGFTGGPGSFVGLAGGFLIGFLPMAFLCGLGNRVSPSARHTVSGFWRLLFGMAGLFLCHLCGICQFAFLSGNSLPAAFLLVSLPYLLKDILSVAAAFFVGQAIRKGLNRI